MESIVLFVLFVFGFYCLKRYTKNLGKGCCGSNQSMIREKINIDEREYPIKNIYLIDGMSCDNCAAIIERRLNKIDYKGVVNFKEKTLTLYSKKEVSFLEIEEIVKNAGYSLRV